MIDGHYLNLPVMDDEKHIIGLVDVLRLTYATLDQVGNLLSLVNKDVILMSVW